MFNPDSVSKIVTTYFAAITKNPFTYKGKRYEPKTLKVSPLVVRGLSCPSGCGGCCMRTSLDFLETESHPYPLTPRYIPFDGRQVLVYSDTQTDNHTKWCKHRGPIDGRCGIHTKHAFSCDFETIKFFIAKRDEDANRLTNMPFPRKWSYTRVDGGKGGLCSALPATKETVADAVRRVRRLKTWADYFGVEHVLDEIIPWLESGPHMNGITVNQHVKDNLQLTMFFTK